jgi:hypothetical protein
LDDQPVDEDNKNAEVESEADAYENLAQAIAL